MKRVLRFIELLWIMKHDVWTMTEDPRFGVHWHFASFVTKEQFDIIFKHLHAAHIAYAQELKELHNRNVRSLKARFAKRNKHGQFVKGKKK